MEIIINNEEYKITLENNATVLALLKLLPLEMEMQELNGNEKYFYLDSTLPTNSQVPISINAGDLMLYGNNCLVLFYKTFKTTYSYTKIGHISNFEPLNNENIQVKLISK